MAKNSAEEFPNLRNEDGSIGTPMPERQPGDVYCNACGDSGPTGTMSVYNVESGQWTWEDCYSHNPVAH